MEDLHNWKKLKEEYAFDGYRKIVRKTYQLPNQAEFTFEIVRVPRFVSIAALTKDKKVILVKQFRPGPEEVVISVPEGQLDDDETPEIAVERELLEETGYKAKEIIFLKEVPEAYSETRKLCFLALNCEKIQEQKLDDSEQIEVQLVATEDFKKMLRNTQANNFSSIDVAYMALDYLGEF